MGTDPPPALTGPAIVSIAAVVRNGLPDWYHRYLALAGGVMAVSLSLVFDVIDVARFFAA